MTAILYYGQMAGSIYGMRTKKITVHVPHDLLSRAQKVSRAGITETIRTGLELLAAGRAYDNVRKLRGKVRFSLDLETLRAD